MELTQFIPIKTGEKFTDNTKTINKDQKSIAFTASSSSFFSDEFKPFKAFNGSTDNTIFWQSNTYPNSNNPKPTITRPKVPNPYTQTPYLSSDGTYQGGGRSNGYYFSTNIKSTNSNNISSGEWIQIQLPTPILLTLYSILAPSQQDTVNFFPQKFTLAGSEDGITWNYIDSQDVNNNIYDCKDRKPILFTVSNTTPYSYFRLIINKLPNNNTIVKINQFNLSGIYPIESFTGNQIIEEPINPQFYGPFPSLNTFSSNFSKFFISEPMTGGRDSSLGFVPPAALQNLHLSSSKNKAHMRGIIGINSSQNYGYGQGDAILQQLNMQSALRSEDFGSYYPLLITNDAVLETDHYYEDDKIFIGSILIILAGTFIYTLITSKH